MIGSHNLSKAAWGMLIKDKSKLMVRSYEVSVLVTPQLEEAYRNHPLRGFSCAPVNDQVSVSHNVDGCRGSQELGECGADRKTQIEFWALPAAKASCLRNSSSVSAAVTDDPALGLQKAVKLYLPLPFDVPPQRYDADDQPWTNDTLHEGIDAIGRQYGQPGWAMYGHRESRD